MTQNKTAICTPTKTRAEFESILRELDGIVGVRWRGSGDMPSTRSSYWSDGDYLVYNFNGDQALLTGLGMEGRIPVLSRADFISAIKRDFAPKEKPKMNYNKMLKKDLIEAIKIIRVDNAELRANYGISKEENKLHRVELDRLLSQNRECFENITALEKTNEEFRAKWTEQDRQLNRSDRVKNATIELLEKAEGKILELKKTNAEQAETIEQLNRARDEWEEESIRYAKNSDYHEGKREEAERENLRLQRHAAQMLCPDVLEGK